MKGIMREIMIKYSEHSEEGDIPLSWWEDTLARVGIVSGPWEMELTWIQGDRTVF